VQFSDRDERLKIQQSNFDVLNPLKMNANFLKNQLHFREKIGSISGGR